MEFANATLATRAVMILAALVLMAAIALAPTGLMTGARHADVAVVPGNKVEPGGQPSPRLAARLDRAYNCYAASGYPPIASSWTAPASTPQPPLGTPAPTILAAENVS
jgi:hypothetical protein